MHSLENSKLLQESHKNQRKKKVKKRRMKQIKGLQEGHCRDQDHLINFKKTMTMMVKMMTKMTMGIDEESRRIA